MQCYDERSTTTPHMLSLCEIVTPSWEVALDRVASGLVLGVEAVCDFASATPQDQHLSTGTTPPPTTTSRVETGYWCTIAKHCLPHEREGGMADDNHHL